MSEFRPNLKAMETRVQAIRLADDQPPGLPSQETCIRRDGAAWVSEHKYSLVIGVYSEQWLGGSLLLEGIDADGGYQCEMIIDEGDEQ